MRRRTLTALMTVVAVTGVCTAAFAGTVGDVDTSLTGDTAYEYNHVTVTGL